ncbi:MAG: hypothetical protein IJ689_04845 [Alphaproteobacteria bacterium]|nr:hypothetical protein [Alphaproteobacteria bacterium]
MKKYILLLGVASVALGSYAAYAGNSATMTVTATMAHDVSLVKVKDINLGTITIDPSQTTGWTEADHRSSAPEYGGGVIAVSNWEWGEITANIPESDTLRIINEQIDAPLGIEEGFIYHISDNRYGVNLSIYYDSLPAQKTYNGSIEIIYVE